MRCEKCQSTADVAFIPTGYCSESGGRLYTCAACHLKTHTGVDPDTDEVRYRDYFGTLHDRQWEENEERLQILANGGRAGCCRSCYQVYSANCLNCQMRQDTLRWDAQQKTKLHWLAPHLFPRIDRDYRAGRRAYQDGLAFEANPHLRWDYRVGDHESRLGMWWAGWDEAEQDAHPEPNRDHYTFRVYTREDLATLDLPASSSPA